MKAVTLTQPWATLVAIGAKTYETRSWSTDYRGPLAIHAAKTMPQEAIIAARHPAFIDKLRPAGFVFDDGFWSGLPFGKVLAVVNLDDCVPVESLKVLSLYEAAFGDYSAGRWVWKLSKPYMLKELPVCRGSLGVWDLPADIALKIEAGVI